MKHSLKSIFAKENENKSPADNADLRGNKSAIISEICGKYFQMKKIFLLFICITIVEFTYGQNYFQNGGTDNNWGTTNNWSLGAVPTSTVDVVFDANSPICTTDVAGLCKTLNFTGYTNTIRMNNGITVSGNVTLVTTMTITGSSGLTVNATATLTSNTKTWPNDLTLSGSSATYTLGDNWTINGTFTSGGSSNTMNGFNLNIGGGLTVTNTVTGLIGSTNVILNGGTWSGNNGFRCNLELKPTGTNTITVSGTVVYNTGTLAYTGPGTVTTTGSTLTINTTATLNTTGITWNNVSFNAGGTTTATISSNLDVTGTLTTSGSNAITFNTGTGTINAKGNITVNNTSAAGGGSATVEINGGVNQTLTGSGVAGTGRLPNIVINKSSNTLWLASIITVAGDWTYTTGTVNASTNSSTVVFVNTQNTDGEGPSATMSFYNVTVKTGTRTLTGAFNVANDLVISSGATLEQNSTTPRTMFIGRDWTNNGTYNTRSAEVTFNGSVLQTISKTSGSGIETFEKMVVSKSSNNVSLSSPIVINNYLTLTNGNIDATASPNYYVQLVDNATTSGASSSSFVVGKFKKVGDDGNNDFTFPVGRGTNNYKPITTTFTSAPAATDEFTAEYFNSNPQAAYCTSLTKTNVSNCQYWTLSRDAGTATPSVTLTWNAVACTSDAVTPITLMRVAHCNGTIWENLGNGGTTGNQSAGSVITASGVTDFSNCFALGNCGGEWTQMANFGGTARDLAAGFSIGTKGYIGTGRTASGNPETYVKDFWEYDQSTNVWTQKADFGGTARNQAVGFATSSKGYIGTGFDGSTKNDFWEYDPSNNTWTQKANFGGAARIDAVGFSIGSKGYIGTGHDGTNYKNDFWEYDPSTDAWTQKANFGGSARYLAVGFSIGTTKGYIGTGYDGTNNTQDFWEYDQAGNSWTQKSNIGQLFAGGAGFSIGTKGYIGVTYTFKEWDQASDTWTQKSDKQGHAIYYSVGFSIGSKGYIGLGVDPFTQEFWEYNPTACSGNNMRFANHPDFIPPDPEELLHLVKKQKAAGTVTIYPNPTADLLNINIALVENDKAVFELYDLYGREVVRNEITDSNKKQISLVGMPDGVYMYKVISNEKVINTGKLVKIE